MTPLVAAWALGFATGYGLWPLAAWLVRRELGRGAKAARS